jgi:hypothetical protein
MQAATGSSRFHPTAILATAALVLLSACAHTANVAPPAEGSDCAQLQRELTALEQARQEAAARQSGAWKAIVPFAVVGRYASGKAAGAQAEQDIAARQAALQRQGCERHGA